MSSEIAIKVSNICKYYQVYDKPIDRLKQTLFGGRRQYYNEFKALDNVSLEIKKGETVGIVGRNGSGKSTLLQIICGTLEPTSGVVEVNGRVAALLELGAGFNPEFTGKENVYMNAAILGLSREEIEERYDEIVRFSEIGDFIEQPVKTYSSGMYVRLAFAVIAHVDADILIIDEALAVGDAFFTQKCMRFLRNFMEKGTVLFVSHDTGSVVNLCSKAVLLTNGMVADTGSPKDVTERYLETLYETSQEVAGVVSDESGLGGNQGESQSEYRDMRDDMINASNLRNDIEVFKFMPDKEGFGTGYMKITSVRLLDQSGAALSWVVGGEDVVLEIRCLAYKRIPRPIVGFQFKDRLGQIIFADNTFIVYEHRPLLVEKEGELVAKFEFRMPVLPAGDYSVAVAVADGTQDNHVQHHWMHDALIVCVHASSICFGLVGIPMKKISLEVES